MDPNNEERQRMVKDAMKTFYPPEHKTEEEVLVERMKDISRAVHKDFMAMQAIEPRLVVDQFFRTKTMSGLYIDRLRSWSKEELMFVAIMLLVEAHIANV